MAKTKAIYAGSFSPITLGHLAIIEQAGDIFDKVIVAVGNNSANTSLFTVDERVDLIYQSLVQYGIPEYIDHVTSFDGLLVDLANEMETTHLVRGLRAASDFDFEFMLHGTNERMEPDLVTTFFMAPQDFMFVSSSTAKELAKNGKDVSWLVTPCVEEALREKYKS